MAISVNRLVTILAAVGSIALVGTPVLAQRSSTSLSNSDRQYLTQAAQGSAYEFEVAQLGVEKASSPATQQYAQKLLNDHAQYNLKLLQLARQKGITVPVTAAANQQSTINRLMGLSGAAFDRAFAQEMIRINSEDISDSQKQLKSTRDSDLQAFINQFAPGDQQHLQEARAISGNTAQSSR